MSQGTAANQRLGEIDALRGLAALAVVLFHYTTQYQNLFPSAAQASVSAPWGYLGVNLFFIISGFVIFMTLDRTRRPMDFVVSRFSRLFPSHWLAIALTFTVVSLFGLPGKDVTLPQALANTVMLHGFAHVPHVDGVYWTLEVELLFYIAMYMLYRFGKLSSVHRAIWLLLGIRLCYFAMARLFGIDLPWLVYRTLFLIAAPWFALGICIYQLTRQTTADGGPEYSQATMVAAIATLLVTEPWYMALLAASMSGTIYLAARDKLPNLRLKAPVMVANSTYCSSQDPDLARRRQIQIRAALLQLHALHSDVLPGPDTDMLTGPYRSGPCHFSIAGLNAAARMWSLHIAKVREAINSDSARKGHDTAMQP